MSAPSQNVFVEMMYQPNPYCGDTCKCNKPIQHIDILNRVYRLSRFHIGDRVKLVVPTNDPSINDLGHIGEVVGMFFGDSNVLRVRWRMPNIARWISGAYGDGKYLIESLVDPFHVIPMEEIRGLPDWDGMVNK